MIGKVISNRYEIKAFLGRGGMAWVYESLDRKTGATVALKILYPQFTDDPAYIQRFVREAKLALTLDHPNIVRVLDYGADRDTHYLVMEFIEGQDMKEVLRETGGALPPQVALSVARQVAEALQEAWKKGIVHRDIKPQNLMRTPDGQIKVLDFGIARAEEFATITGSGFVGSPYYVAPEQAMSQAVDTRSDIYSLGVVLYEMLCGQLPFDAETPWSIISQHISHVPLPVSEIRADIPRSVADLVSTMLAKHPGDRFHEPGELLLEIDALLTGMEEREPAEEEPLVEPDEAPPIEPLPELTAEAVEAPQTAPPEAPPTPLPEPVVRQIPWPVLGVVALLLIVVGGWLLRSRGGTETPSPTPTTVLAVVAPATPTRLPPTPTARHPSPIETSLPVAVAVSPTPTTAIADTKTPTESPTSVTATSVPPTATPTASLTASPTAMPTVAQAAPPPAVVATSNRIAFKSDATGQEQLYIMDTDGGNWQRLPDTAIYDQARQAIPRSPDNLREAIVRFVSEEDSEIFVRWLDNRGPESQLVFNPALDYDPSWAPDSVHIAFVSRRQGSDDIFVTEFPGRNDRQLTDTPNATERHPSWSPEGSQIVFWSDREFGRKQIWIMNADGSAPHLIGDGQHNDWDPVWLP